MNLQRHNMTPEQAAYEIPEIWEIDWFDAIDRERVKLFADKIPEEVKSLLDVGCGNGLFLNYLKSRRGISEYRLCGADRSQAALKHVQTEKYIASIDRLPFNDNEFDIATSLEVLEHLPSTIYYESLKEICRIARKYVLIGVPFNQDIRNSLIECPYCGCRFNADYHLRSFSEKIMTNLFDAHSFHCKEIFFIHPIKIRMPWFYNLCLPISVLKNTYRIPDLKRYPGYAVCPACFYENRKNLELRNKHVMCERNIMRRILSRLCGGFIHMQSYRWIGALYEKK